MVKEGCLSFPEFKTFKGTYEHILKDQNLGVLLNAYSYDTFLGGLLILGGLSLPILNGMLFQENL